MTIFENNIINLYGDLGKLWLADLPNIIAQLTHKWSLTKLTLVQNLTYSYVLFGFQGNLPITLKLALNENALNQEAEALKAFAGFGAIRLLEQEKGALLLERAIPGTSLKTYFPDQEEEAIHITCDIMKKLHCAPFPQSVFPHIQQWLEVLDKEWDIPSPFLQKSRDLRDHLLKTSPKNVLLHGDLHHDNILAHHNEWIAIDPKGVVGDHVYDVAAFIRNPIPDLLEKNGAYDLIKNRIIKFAQTLNIDDKRVHDWCFVQSVLAWIWALEDRGEAYYFKNITEIFNVYY
ncbi:MAG TPA: aminoglycoside phosphotransferase family protein [Candidatus Nitrosotenuis sp.]|jgi:streptomycin 6-kinase|nr:aminoglycoside phosphotransferase family protein [Candidatus Nitrosotenuis sp.]